MWSQKGRGTHEIRGLSWKLSYIFIRKRGQLVRTYVMHSPLHASRSHDQSLLLVTGGGAVHLCLDPPTGMQMSVSEVCWFTYLITGQRQTSLTSSRLKEYLMRLQSVYEVASADVTESKTVSSLCSFLHWWWSLRHLLLKGFFLCYPCIQRPSFRSTNKSAASRLSRSNSALSSG